MDAKTAVDHILASHVHAGANPTPEAVLADADFPSATDIQWAENHGVDKDELIEAWESLRHDVTF